MKQVIPDTFVDELCTVAHDLLPTHPRRLARQARTFANRLQVALNEVDEDKEKKLKRANLSARERTNLEKAGKRQRESLLALALMFGLALAKSSELSPEEVRGIVSEWDSNLDVDSATRVGRVDAVRDTITKLVWALPITDSDDCPRRELTRYLRAAVAAIEAEGMNTLALYLAVGRLQQNYGSATTRREL